jgi:hypothetical protein
MTKPDAKRVWKAALVVALAVTTAGAAQAQETPPAPGAGTEPPATEPVNETPPAPPAAPVVATPAPAAAEPESASSGRPEAFAIGIGAGYVFPADIGKPDRASVRFRLASGLTFEPFVDVGRAARSVKTDIPNVEVPHVNDSSMTFSAGTNLRLPLKSRGAFDLVLIGSVSLAYVSQDPDGSDNDTKTFAASLGWGLGIDWWLTPRWTLSLSATNPLASYRRAKQENGPDSSITTSDTSFDLAFLPTVSALLHLYF